MTVTILVVIVNVAVVDPALTVTELGTFAIVVVPDVSVTAVPPDGAALPRVTVPVDVFPPTTEAGLSVTPVTTGGVTVRTAVLLEDEAASDAVMVTLVDFVTADVEIANVAEVAPAGIVTVAGTVAAAVLFDAKVIE